jgi:hypothetical protein
MEMMNRAIEDAAAFANLKRRLVAEQSAFAKAVRQEVERDVLEASAPEPTAMDRQPGENRAEHRARLKRERRDAKRTKASA